MKGKLFLCFILLVFLMFFSSCITEKKEIFPTESIIFTFPSGVSATQGDFSNKIVICWDRVTGAEGYRVYRSTSYDSGFTKIKTTKQTYYEDKNVSSSVVYYYKIKAYSSQYGLTPYSGVAFGFISGGFTPPTNLTASKSDHPDHIEIAWTSVENAEYYVILRSRSPGSGYVTLDTTDVNSYTDYVPTTGSYFYKVKAYSSQYGLGVETDYVYGCRRETLTLVDSWDESGAGDTRLYGIDIEVDYAGNIYILELTKNRIQKFDSNGNYIIHWGTGPSSTDGEFDQPRSFVLDNYGNLFVVDYGNHRVQKFDSNGNFLDKFGSDGINPGQFHYPQGIAVDDNGDIYVADSNHFQIFNSGFSNIMDYNLNHSLNCDDSGYYVAAEDIVVDNQGNIIIADLGCLYVRIWNSTLNPMYKIGGGLSGSGSECDLSDMVMDVSVNSEGSIYFTEYNTGNIYKSDRYGNCLQEFNISGYSPQLYGIYVFQDEYLFLTGNDSTGALNMIMKFQLE